MLTKGQLPWNFLTKMKSNHGRLSTELWWQCQHLRNPGKATLRAATGSSSNFLGCPRSASALLGWCGRSHDQNNESRQISSFGIGNYRDLCTLNTICINSSLLCLWWYLLQLNSFGNCFPFLLQQEKNKKMENWLKKSLPRKFLLFFPPPLQIFASL